MADVTMPRLSDTMEEGTVAKWLKRPGDPVQRGEVLAQIETDKATMDLQAYDSGTLQEILVDEGATVPIGQPIARIGPAGATASRSTDGPPAAEATQAEQPAAPRPGRTAPPRPEESAERGRGDGGTEERGRPQAPTERPGPPTADGAAAGKVRASPLARRMAEEHGLELASIRGSGPEGRVIRADVESALAARPAPAEAIPVARAPAAVGMEREEERVPLSAMRRTIARRMAESTRTIPHFFLTATVDATELVNLRRQLVQQLEAAGEDTKVSLNDLIVRAAALALRRVPEVNVSFAEDALIRHGQVHVGIAVALENGLVVPVVRAADQKSVGQIARESRDLVERARAGKLQPAEYSGGTFTVSNLGMFGIEQFNAVINPPEAAILAVGAVVREPVEHQGQVALRDRMKLTMAIDHRALDGATGARFLQTLKKLLEQPLLLLV
jgi:pyruvate dehydrogenase E2 component (dihydrolipoamide acetyltransferase)